MRIVSAGILWMLKYLAVGRGREREHMNKNEILQQLLQNVGIVKATAIVAELQNIHAAHIYINNNIYTKRNEYMRKSFIFFQAFLFYSNDSLVFPTKMRA